MSVKRRHLANSAAEGQIFDARCYTTYRCISVQVYLGTPPANDGLIQINALLRGLYRMAAGVDEKRSGYLVA